MRGVDPIEKPRSHRQTDQCGNQKAGQTMQPRLDALSCEPETLHAAYNAHSCHNRDGFFHTHHLQPDTETHQSGSKTRQTVDVAAQSGTCS